jgi:hypothetical protein
MADRNECFAITKDFGVNVVQLAAWAICISSRTGNAIEWRVSSAINVIGLAAQ